MLCPTTHRNATRQRRVVYLCGDDCFIWRENSHCWYMPVYVQCWIEDDPETGDGHWEQSFDCVNTPCYI